MGKIFFKWLSGNLMPTEIVLCFIFIFLWADTFVYGALFAARIGSRSRWSSECGNSLCFLGRIPLIVCIQWVSVLCAQLEPNNEHPLLWLAFHVSHSLHRSPWWGRVEFYGVAGIELPYNLWGCWFLAVLATILGWRRLKNPTVILAIPWCMATQTWRE